ncbi:MAG: DUF5765 domain-containing protein [Gammaproteobacteria bacterium]
MCWSAEASFALATVGFATVGVAAKQGEKKELFLPLLWFSLMELLQGFTYWWIDMCDSPPNQVLTLLGYLHIAFQPFFANMISMYFLPEGVHRRLAPWVYSLCFAGAIAMIIDIYPFAWAEHSTLHMLDSTKLCSVSGDWHIAWHVPVFDTSWARFGFVKEPYFIMVFLVPLLYGSWKFTLYHILTGVILSVALTRDSHETAAVWCLLSIGLLTVVAKTPIRKVLFIRRWYGVHYPRWLGGEGRRRVLATPDAATGSALDT